MTRRKLQYTLEDVANKLEWKNFIYKTQEQKQRDIQDLVYNIVYLKISGEDGIGKADEARRIADSGDFSMLSADDKALIRQLSARQDMVQECLAVLIDGEQWSQEKINTRMGNLYANAAEIDLLHKWLFSKPSNGKDNLYSAFSDYYTCESLTIAITPFLYGLFMFGHAKRKQKEYFELVKQTIINRLSRDITPGIRDVLHYRFFLGGHGEEKEYRAALADIIQKLNGITYADVSYHKTKSKLVARTNDDKDAFGLVAPLIDDIVKVGSSTPTQDESGKFVYSIPSNDLILETLKRYPALGITFDKFMRVSLAYGISNGEQKFANDGVVKGKIADLMHFAGYTPEEIATKSCRHNFTNDLANFLIMCEQAGSGGKSGGLAISGKSKPLQYKEDAKDKPKEIHKIGFIQQSQDVQNGKFFFALDYVFKQMLFANGIIKQPFSKASFRIDSKDRPTYFIYRKLEQLAGMKKNIGHNREDTVSTTTLIKTLEEYSVITSHSYTRYKQFIARRIYDALNNLQDTYNIIEYYFYKDDKNQPIPQQEIDSYLNQENFSKLKIWFIVKGLENYIDSNKEQFVDDVKKMEQENKRRLSYRRKQNKAETPTKEEEQPREKSPFETY